MTFLTMTIKISTITIQRDLLSPTWDILGEVFYNNSEAGTFLKRCSTVVPENSKRFVLDQF